MKINAQFKSLKTRLLVWFLLVSLIPLIAVSLTLLAQEVASIKKNAFTKLTSIRDLKIAQVHAWLDGKIGDIQTVAADFEVRHLETSFGDRTGAAAEVVEAARNVLANQVKHIGDYHELFLINAETGVVEISSDKSAEGQVKTDDPAFTEPLRTRQVFVKDIYYSKALGKLSMAFSMPVYCLAHQGAHLFGILVARVDPDQSLYALLLDRTGMGRTGETLIVNSETVALNELRWHEHAPMRLRITAEPAVLASQGQEGIVETVDYRQEKVLAAYSFIPRTRWGFVAKQDQAEIYAPIQDMLKNTLILLIISAGGVSLVAYALAQGLSRPVASMTRVSQRIRAGELNVRNTLTSRDELGFLAASFNEMADSVAEQMEVQQGVAQIVESMVSTRELQVAQTALFECLLHLTHSDLGAFYWLNKDRTQYDLIAARGVSDELLRPIEVTGRVGEFDKVLTTRQIVLLADIPEDTPFHLKTFAGTANPKAIVTIPLMVRDQVMAIISLASLKSYPPRRLQMIKQSWKSMNTAFSNLLASEETRLLARSLHDTNETLQSQSQELQAQNEEIRAQRCQVEESNRLKSEFLSNMSHELRTPLNSVMVLSRVLATEGKEVLTDEHMRYLEVIERNGRNLLTTINNILDLSKIEAGHIDVAPESLSLAQVLGAMVETLAPLAEDKGIELDMEVPGALDMVTDRTRLDHILQNLVGNAIKFTPEGRVSIKASVQGDCAVIQVSDTGIGIPAAELPYVFSEFRQVDGSASRRFEGTGLGLAIAQKNAHVLGGSIAVSSTLRQGSTFTLKLPLIFKDTRRLAQPFLQPAHSTSTAPCQTILVVDDEIEMIEMMASILSDEGYQVIAARAGQEALELARQHQPFAITLDVMMPETDGWEVLQHLKHDPATANIPIIMVTVCEDRGTGLALGAAGHVTKPVGKTALLHEIRRLKSPCIHRILLVEDNEAAVLQVKNILEREGFVVDVASGGQQALDYVQHTIPSGIILDLMMPEVDGFSVLESVRGSAATACLPVLILTAKELTPADRQKLSANHIQELVQKGRIDGDGLLLKVRHMLGLVPRPVPEAKGVGPVDKGERRERRNFDADNSGH